MLTRKVSADRKGANIIIRKAKQEFLKYSDNSIKIKWRKRKYDSFIYHKQAHNISNGTVKLCLKQSKPHILQST